MASEPITVLLSVERVAEILAGHAVGLLRLKLSEVERADVRFRYEPGIMKLSEVKVTVFPKADKSDEV